MCSSIPQKAELTYPCCWKRSGCLPYPWTAPFPQWGASGALNLDHIACRPLPVQSQNRGLPLKRRCSFARVLAAVAPYVSHMNLSDPKVYIRRVLFLPSTRIAFAARYAVEFLFVVHSSLIGVTIKKRKQKGSVHQGHYIWHSQTAMFPFHPWFLSKEIHRHLSPRYPDPSYICKIFLCLLQYFLYSRAWTTCICG